MISFISNIKWDNIHYLIKKNLWTLTTVWWRAGYGKEGQDWNKKYWNFDGRYITVKHEYLNKTNTYTLANNNIATKIFCYWM